MKLNSATLSFVNRFGELSLKVLKAAFGLVYPPMRIALENELQIALSSKELLEKIENAIQKAVDKAEVKDLEETCQKAAFDAFRSIMWDDSIKGETISARIALNCKDVLANVKPIRNLKIVVETVKLTPLFMLRSSQNFSTFSMEKQNEAEIEDLRTKKSGELTQKDIDDLESALTARILSTQSSIPFSTFPVSSLYAFYVRRRFREISFTHEFIDLRSRLFQGPKSEEFTRLIERYWIDRVSRLDLFSEIELADSEVSVLIGDAGSGKDMTARFLILNFLKGMPDVGNKRRLALPIFTPAVAKLMETRKLDIKDAVASFLSERFDIPHMDAVLDRAIEAGNAALFFMDYDLVPLNIRGQFAFKLEDFIDSIKANGNFVLVTARKIGYFMMPLQIEGIRVFELLNFNESELRHSLELMSLVESLAGEEAALEAESRVAKILALNESSQSAKKLTENPLMLAIMFKLIRPETREFVSEAELLDEFVRTAVHACVSEGALVGVHPTKFMRALTQLAYAAILDHFVFMSSPKRLRVFVDELTKSLQIRDEKEKEAVRRMLELEGCRLQRRFIEHLAVKEILRRRDLRTLAKKIYDPQWHTLALHAASELGTVALFDADVIQLKELIRTKTSKFEPYIREAELTSAEVAAHASLLNGSELVRNAAKTIEANNFVLRHRTIELIRAARGTHNESTVLDVLNSALRANFWNRAATSALRMFGVVSPELIEALRMCLDGKNPYQKQRCVELIAKLNLFDSETIEKLVILTKSDGPLLLRSTAAFALALFADQDETARKVVTSLIEKPTEPLLRLAALHYFFKKRDVDDEILQKAVRIALMNADARTRNLMVKWLRQLIGQGLAGKIATEVKKYLIETSEIAQSNAIELVMQLKLMRKDILETLASIAEKGSEVLRAKALEALAALYDGQFDCQKILSICMKLARDETASIRASAIRSVAKLDCGKDEAVRFLLNTIEEGEPKVREAAIEALGEMRIRNKKVMEKLLSAFEDRYPMNRAAALDAIAKLGVKDERLTDSIRRMLTEERWLVVQERALAAIRSLKIADDHVVQSVAEMAVKGHIKLRETAIDTLTALSSASSKPNDALIRILQNPDVVPNVKLKVLRALSRTLSEDELKKKILTILRQADNTLTTSFALQLLARVSTSPAGIYKLLINLLEQPEPIRSYGYLTTLALLGKSAEKVRV